MRGEDLKGLLDMRDCKETPPHAWGRHPQVTHEHQPCGNTPTCVGKTLVLKIRHNTLQKHPHMRGEDVQKALLEQLKEETPPHAWGRPRTAVPAFAGVGNTPTCVGKTQKALPGSDIRKKHPHMRGEDRRRIGCAKPIAETPPHAWGRHPGYLLALLDHGNTPTCVGKTEEG